MVSAASPQDVAGRRRKRLVQGIISIAAIAAVFYYALPQFASFSQVWDVVKGMSVVEIALLVLVATWNIVTYWFVMMSSLPGSNIWQAMKINQISTAVSNTLPGGSAIGIGVTYAMYTGYGFSHSEISLSVLVTGIWNNFVKLGMPIIAVGLLVFGGNASTGLATAAAIGIGVLLGAIVLFGLILYSDRLARSVGRRLQPILNRVRQLLRKDQVSGLDERAVGFRREVIHLLRRRWAWLTLATLVSHLSLYAVLLESLHAVGVSNSQVSWIEVLAAFSFVRLISALPLTPGGIGVVELGLTAALVAAGGDHAEVLAGVLVYRVLTYVAPIPFGLFAYAKWKRGAAARALRAANRRAERAIANSKG